MDAGCCAGRHASVGFPITRVQLRMDRTYAVRTRGGSCSTQSAALQETEAMRNLDDIVDAGRLSRHYAWSSSCSALAGCDGVGTRIGNTLDWMAWYCSCTPGMSWRDLECTGRSTFAQLIRRHDRYRQGRGVLRRCAWPMVRCGVDQLHASYRKALVRRLRVLGWDPWLTKPSNLQLMEPI